MATLDITKFIASICARGVRPGEVLMPVYCVFERSGASEAMFNVAARSSDEARKLVTLNCDVPADDPNIYGCETDHSVSVDWGVIVPVIGDRIPIVRI